MDSKSHVCMKLNLYLKIHYYLDDYKIFCENKRVIMRIDVKVTITQTSQLYVAKRTSCIS